MSETTLQWLDNLHETIKSAVCKTRGKSCSFEAACKSSQDLIESVRREKKRIWWAGNGGSAAICSHLSQDVMNKLGIHSFFYGDTALLTCMANDFGYENVYSRPMENFVEPGDLMIAVSSSGNSQNILNCAELAKDKGMRLITLSGMKETNPLFQAPSDVSFLLLSDLYGIVETGHEAVLHGIIETLWIKTRTEK